MNAALHGIHVATVEKILQEKRATFNAFAIPVPLGSRNLVVRCGAGRVSVALMQ
jgi:hypothetical protein